MGDKVPIVCFTKKESSSTCMKWTKSLNNSLMISLMVVLGGFSCGICVIYFCVPCAVTKPASCGDLTTSSNVTHFQSQIPAQTLNVLSMCNVSFIGDSSNLQHPILQGVFDFLLAIEDIDKSLPQILEGGVIMLCDDLLQVIQQLEYNVQKAVKHVKNLQESLEPKHRRRPPLH